MLVVFSKIPFSLSAEPLLSVLIASFPGLFLLDPILLLTTVRFVVSQG